MPYGQLPQNWINQYLLTPEERDSMLQYLGTVAGNPQVLASQRTGQPGDGLERVLNLIHDAKQDGLGKALGNYVRANGGGVGRMLKANDRIVAAKKARQDKIDEINADFQKAREAQQAPPLLSDAAKQASLSRLQVPDQYLRPSSGTQDFSSSMPSTLELLSNTKYQGDFSGAASYLPTPELGLKLNPLHAADAFANQLLDAAAPRYDAAPAAPREYAGPPIPANKAAVLARQADQTPTTTLHMTADDLDEPMSAYTRRMYDRDIVRGGLPNTLDLLRTPPPTAAGPPIPADLGRRQATPASVSAPASPNTYYGPVASHTFDPTAWNDQQYAGPSIPDAAIERQAVKDQAARFAAYDAGLTATDVRTGTGWTLAGVPKLGVTHDMLNRVGPYGPMGPTSQPLPMPGGQPSSAVPMAAGKAIALRKALAPAGGTGTRQDFMKGVFDSALMDGGASMTADDARLLPEVSGYALQDASPYAAPDAAYGQAPQMAPPAAAVAPTASAGSGLAQSQPIDAGGYRFPTEGVQQMTGMLPDVAQAMRDQLARVNRAGTMWDEQSDMFRNSEAYGVVPDNSSGLLLSNRTRPDALPPSPPTGLWGLIKARAVPAAYNEEYKAKLNQWEMNQRRTPGSLLYGEDRLKNANALAAQQHELAGTENELGSTYREMGMGTNAFTEAAEHMQTAQGVRDLQNAKAAFAAKIEGTPGFGNYGSAYKAGALGPEQVGQVVGALDGGTTVKQLDARMSGQEAANHAQQELDIKRADLGLRSKQLSLEEGRAVLEYTKELLPVADPTVAAYMARYYVNGLDPREKEVLEKSGVAQAFAQSTAVYRSLVQAKTTGHGSNGETPEEAELKLANAAKALTESIAKAKEFGGPEGEAVAGQLTTQVNFLLSQANMRNAEEMMLREYLQSHPGATPEQAQQEIMKQRSAGATKASPAAAVARLKATEPGLLRDNAVVLLKLRKAFGSDLSELADPKEAENLLLWAKQRDANNNDPNYFGFVTPGTRGKETHAAEADVRNLILYAKQAQAKKVSKAQKFMSEFDADGSAQPPAGAK